LIDGLASHDVQINREQYATSGRDDARLFGVLDLVIPNLAQPDYALCVGIRASNDRSLAIQATAGARVFVCDNLAFSGDSGTVVLKRKHTARLDLSVVVPPAIDTYLQKAGLFVLDIEKMKNHELTDSRAKEVIYDAFMRRVMPLRYLPDVHKIYFDDEVQRQKFNDRSLWSLNNAFTEVSKDLRVVPQQSAGMKLGRYFNLVLNERSPGHFGMVSPDVELPN
jgi:hypothetical protein